MENLEINKTDLVNYVENIQKLTEPYKKVQKMIRDNQESMKNMLNSIENITKSLKNLQDNRDQRTKNIIETNKAIIFEINKFREDYNNFLQVTTIPKLQTQMNTIKDIMSVNNGYITSKMIEPLNISRHCFSMLEKNNEIERIARGIYISKSTFEDGYYIFQRKYSKAIFSHMNALFFYGLTEEFPYQFTVTVPNSYHVEKINKKHFVFYANEDIYDIGINEVKTPYGNKVRAYDIERCICDIIRFRKKMDEEQVKKSVREYLKRKDKDITKISEYAEKLGCKEEVVDFVGMLYE